MNSEYINERRELGDRRITDNDPPFPFFDSEQTLVRENRRRMPDRRINNIQIDNNEDSTKEATRLFLWHKEEVCELFPSTNEIIVGRAQSCELIFQTNTLHANMHDSNLIMANSLSQTTAQTALTLKTMKVKFF